MRSQHVSVIVPSYNGKEKVIRLLHSLEKQTSLPLEIIVVVDGSTDGTAAALNDLHWEIPSLRVLETPNNGRAGARNYGAEQASYDLLLFFDDDLILKDTCVEAHVHASNYKEKRIVMGQILEPSDAADTEIKKYKDYLNRSWAENIDPYKQQNFPNNITLLSAQNFSISKGLFNLLGGFNPILKDIEDYDLALRAKALRIPVFYLDTAIALHRDHFSFRKYADRSKDYLKNRLIARNLNPALYENDVILNHKNSALKKFMYSFFTHTFWFKVLDSYNAFVYILPKKIRYKLYSIVITAYIHNQQK